MARGHEFAPDWASAPGDTIADILGEREISLADFAAQIGQTPEEAMDLLQGRATITLKTARLLGQALGASVEFWMSRDFQYREDASRIHAADRGWLSELPLSDMIKFGWLRPVPHPSEEVGACLRYFGLPTVSAWRQAYADLVDAVAFQDVTVIRLSPRGSRRVVAAGRDRSRGDGVRQLGSGLLPAVSSASPDTDARRTLRVSSRRYKPCAQQAVLRCQSSARRMGVGRAAPPDSYPRARPCYC